jgi:type IV pilus secretin PilQ/predicted competence protein
MNKLIPSLILAATILSCATDNAKPEYKNSSYSPPDVSEAKYGPIPSEFNINPGPEKKITMAENKLKAHNSPGETKPTASHDTDQLVSLNMRGATIDTAIRTLSEAVGFNYVIHPAIKGARASELVMDHVPWLAALEAIIRSNELAATINGIDLFSVEMKSRTINKNDLIFISEYQYLRAEREKINEEAEASALVASRRRKTEEDLAITKRISELQSAITKSYRFKYADPSEALSYLRNLYSRQFPQTALANANSGAVPGALTSAEPQIPRYAATDGGNGVVFALYKAENLITVTAPPRLMARIMSSIDEIDVSPKQVFIEARIVEIQRSVIQELGVQWGGYNYAVTGRNFPNTVGISGSSADPGGIAPNIVSLAPQSAIDPATGSLLASPQGGVIGFTLGGVTGTSLLRARLFALERDGASRTISNPKILVLNGNVATIKSGKEIPYQSSSANSGVNVLFREAVISLSVKPNIMRNNKIRMKIDARKNEVDLALSVQGTPAIRKKEISTTVVVGNGGSAVLGGMFEREDGDFQDRVPWFHKIPLFGALFKSKRTVDNRLELLIFITPTIVDEQSVQ